MYHRSFEEGNFQGSVKFTLYALANIIDICHEEEFLEII